MLVLLETTSGPSVGKQVRLQAGQSVRVGRSRKSDLAFPEDSHISSVHFAVKVDDNGCRLTDLNSTNGTLLNGQRITAAAVQNGDTIVAGETTFRATIEPTEALAAAASPPLSADATPQQRLLALLRNDYQPLYVILDSARDIKILALLMQSKEEYQSLYEGVEGAKLSQVAPYLVKLNEDSLLLGSLLLEGWGNNWGIYLTCDSDFPEVRRHMRRFLEVHLPEGKQVHFRFYDPRVLRVFLPTCTEVEANQFFGPVKHYLMEDEKPDKLLEFVNKGGGADKKVVDLSQAAADEDNRPPSSSGTPTLPWLLKPTPNQPR
jgi:Domain of unknown function (DUF4123)/FHA domain